MKNIVAIDIETTGIDKKKDHIIQISMVKFNPETYEVLDTFDSYVKPEGSYVISIAAYIKHGIKPQFLEDKPYFKDIADKILEFVNDCNILTYNGNSFDLPFLNIEMAKCGKHIDTTKLKCYDSFLTERERYPMTLEGVYSKYMGETMNESGLDAHNSLSDVAATIEVFRKQNEEYPVEPTKIYGDCGLIKDLEFKGAIKPCFSYGKYRQLSIELVAQIDQNYLKWAVSPKSEFDNDTKEFLKTYIKE